MEIEAQNKIKNILHNKESIKIQLSQITEEFQKDQFHAIKDLEDALLEESTPQLHDQYSSILLSFLMKECSHDKYRIEQTFTKLYQHYLKTENCSHLIDPLTHLLNYFSNYIYLEGDKLFGHFISQDINKVERILNLLKFVCKPLKNQIETIDLNVEKLNSIQKQIVDILDVSNVIDGLIKLSEKTFMTGTLKKTKNSKELEMVDQLKEDRIKLLALHILLLLRNLYSKEQKKKAIMLFTKNINEIETICNNEIDLMADYLFFLSINKEDFHKGKEVLVFQKMCMLINEYLKVTQINESNITINSGDKWKFAQQLLEYQHTFSEISDIENLNYIDQAKFKEIYSKQERFLICKNACYKITLKIFFSSARKKMFKNDQNVLFEMILALSKLCFSVFLELKVIPDYDKELYSCVKGLNDTICEEKKTQFLDFIYQKLVQTEKNTEVDKVKSIRILVDIEDKFSVIGCYLILEDLISKIVEDMKGYSIKFMNFISYHLFDEFLFTYVVLFLAEMANCFTSNITAYHLSFMPQLISILKTTQNVHKKELIIDTYSKLYDQLIFQRIKDMYPYLKEIFSYLVNEYLTENFFTKTPTYTESIQQLINQIINLKEIEFYLKDQILETVDLFINSILDPNQRELLISKNHQQCLFGFLQIQMRLNNVSEKLLIEVRQISKEVALKIMKEGSTMKKEEKTTIYQYLKKLTVPTLGSQQLFDEIFLLILPQVLEDAQTNVSIKNYLINQDDREVEELGELDEVEEINEQDEQEDHAQVQYLIPPEIKINLVSESITIFAVISEQSPDIFMNNKKFDILKIIIQNQLNSDLVEDIIIQNQSIIGRILVVVQKYLIQQENDNNQNKLVNGQVQQALSEEQLVEISPLIDILLYRFFHHRDNFIVKQCEDRLFQELNNTIQRLEKCTIFSFFNQFYSLVEIILFENIGIYNTNQIVNCISYLTDILEAAPSRIMDTLEQTWYIIKMILTEQDQPLMTYSHFISVYKLRKEDIIISNISDDPFLVISCINKIQDLLKVQQDSYNIFYPVFHFVILNKDFSQFEQYLQNICEYIKQIIKYCKQKVNPDDIQKYYHILEKIANVVNEDYYREISPVENLRIAFAMLGTYFQFTTKQQINKLNCFNLFLEIIPLRDELQEFPYVLYILEYLIQNQYQFNAIQKNNVIITLLRAIDNSGNYDASKADIEASLKLLNIIKDQDPYNMELLIKNINQEMSKIPKTMVYKVFNLE